MTKSHVRHARTLDYEMRPHVHPRVYKWNPKRRVCSISALSPRAVAVRERNLGRQWEVSARRGNNHRHLFVSRYKVVTAKRGANRYIDRWIKSERSEGGDVSLSLCFTFFFFSNVWCVYKPNIDPCYVRVFSWTKFRNVSRFSKKHILRSNIA